MKRGASGLSGIIVVDKPRDMTSHDVVDRMRRMTGERRVGHAGTLDPMATGLMFVCVGAATRLSQYLMGHDKAYRARIAFGVGTDTDDAQGRVLKTAPCGLDGVAELVASADRESVLAGIEGPQLQLPPAYSAIKKGGVTAYKAAREGKQLELEPRPVTVHAARFVGSGTQTADLPRMEGGMLHCELVYWDVDLLVSKGTYVRAIARDLGARLGCTAHLAGLRRTLVAQTTLAAARTLEDWEHVFASGGDIPWADPVEALGFPALQLDARQAKAVANGRALPGEGHARGTLVACVADGKLVAVYEQGSGALKPAAVIPGGVSGVQ